MKNYKIVKLTNLTEEYKNANLSLNDCGIEIEKGNKFSNVLFFNQNNVGDYAYLQVDNNDISIEENFPENLTQELITFLTKIKDEYQSKTTLEKNLFNEFDLVELISEKEKYSKFGITKGQQGIVAHNTIIDNHILVDFTGIDKNGNFFGDTISVDINDLKKK